MFISFNVLRFLVSNLGWGRQSLSSDSELGDSSWFLCKLAQSKRVPIQQSGQQSEMMLADNQK